MEATAVEGASPGVPPQEQPPSTTEWSTDLHYGSPAPFQGEKWIPEGTVAPLWASPQSQVAPRARLPRGIFWAPPSSVP